MSRATVPCLVFFASLVSASGCDFSPDGGGLESTPEAGPARDGHDIGPFDGGPEDFDAAPEDSLDTGLHEDADEHGADRPDAGLTDGDVGGDSAVDAGPLSVCGNGRIEGDEACDDGNSLGADGCAPDCRIEPGWRCFRSPSVCFGVVETVFVSKSRTACDERDGSDTDPFCSIQDGLASGAGAVIVLPGEYSGPVKLTRDVALVADGLVEISGGERTLSVEEGRALVVGFVFQWGRKANARVRNSAHLILRDSLVRLSVGVGLSVEGGAGASLDRLTVLQNAGGGLRVHTTGAVEVSNSIVSGNGGRGSSFGGVYYRSAGAGGLFENNTIAKNRSRGRVDESAGVRCDIDVGLSNTIVWGNVGSEGHSSIGPRCLADHSLIGPASAPGDGNLNLDPLLSDELRLTASSPAIDVGSDGIAKGQFDIDLDPRRFGTGPDMGADEFVP